MRDEIVWCDCESSRQEPHAEKDHTDCGMSMRNGEACGGCDSCICAQIYHYRRLEREEV